MRVCCRICSKVIECNSYDTAVLVEHITKTHSEIKFKKDKSTPRLNKYFTRNRSIDSSIPDNLAVIQKLMKAMDQLSKTHNEPKAEVTSEVEKPIEPIKRSKEISMTVYDAENDPNYIESKKNHSRSLENAVPDIGANVNKIRESSPDDKPYIYKIRANAPNFKGYVNRSKHGNGKVNDINLSESAPEKDQDKATIYTESIYVVKSSTSPKKRTGCFHLKKNNQSNLQSTETKYEYNDSIHDLYFTEDLVKNRPAKEKTSRGETQKKTSAGDDDVRNEKIEEKRRVQNLPEPTSPVISLPFAMEDFDDKSEKAEFRRKYIVRTPLSFNKKSKVKLYKTTIEKWRPGKGKICCPRCGAIRRPMIKTETTKTSSSPIGAACILTCWPFCFFPCLFPPPIKEYLYCASCNKFLGIYERKSETLHSCECDN